ncbi:serine hydrolase domain-containing protein [Hyphococcus sp.]|uniref:serine hydrolase domain-containing protein n=1 Tax=Hyphococcus sp. TaxID=2038636 RepID=UPI003CCB87F3
MTFIYNTNTIRFTARRIRQISCCAVALLTLCAPAHAQPLSTPTAVQISDGFDSAGERLRDMGFTGVIALAKDGAAPVYAGFGENAAADGLPDKDTLLDVGSITKTFTGAAAVKLVDQGKLSMADRLSKYFPDAPADKANISVHQLLTHSAGFAPALGEDLEFLSRDEFLNRAMASDLLFEPGSGYEYSNVGFSLAAAIIEQVSGKSYEAFLREELLKGAGVDAVGYEKAFDARKSLLMQDGKAIAEGSWGGKSHWALIGNGGLIATAEDMIKFRRAFAGGDIVSPAAVELAQAPMQREGENAPGHYGYGLVVMEDPFFGRSYWHNGGNGNFFANWTDYADHGLIIFTASNNPEVNADIAAMIVTEELFGVKMMRKAPRDQPE